MSELLKELRDRHALAVHVRDDINASIASLTTELAAANCQIWELESACRALEGASSIAGAIVAPEAVEVADDPVSLTETPSEPQETASQAEAEPLVEAVAEVNQTVEEISKANGGGWNNYWNTHKIAAIETNS
jgi:hypothetical protein